MSIPVNKGKVAIKYLEQFVNEMELQLKEEETNKRTKKHCNKFYSRQIFNKYNYSFKSIINIIKTQNEKLILLYSILNKFITDDHVYSSLSYSLFLIDGTIVITNEEKKIIEELLNE